MKKKILSALAAVLAVCTVTAAPANMTVPAGAAEQSLSGDLDGNGKLEKNDVTALTDYLLCKSSQAERADLDGYIAASSPAPGVVPAHDNFMDHVGSISESEFRMSEPYLPYLLMIAGGTADGMVQDFPEQYHKLFERNNTDHIWISVPNGGHDGGVGGPLFYHFIRALFKA